MKSEQTEKLTPKICKMSLNFEAETSCTPTPYYSISLYALPVIIKLAETPNPTSSAQHMCQQGKFVDFGMSVKLGDRFFNVFFSKSENLNFDDI